MTGGRLSMGSLLFLASGLFVLLEGGEAFLNEREKFVVVYLQVMRGDDGLVDLLFQQVVAGSFFERRVSFFEKAALTRHGLNDTLTLQRGVSLGDGVAVDAKSLGQRADRRQQFTR